MPSVPTRRKRKVGRKLAELRLRKEMTLEQVKVLLRKRDVSVVSKIENGTNLLQWAEIHLLLVTYGATEQESAQVEEWWNDAREDSTRLQGTSALPKILRTYLRNEADADTMFQLQRVAVPGILQTSDYAKALLAAPGQVIDTKVDADRALAARARRQELLVKKNPLRLHAIIDEAAIRRVVGGRKIMADQLEHLLMMAKRANIIVQVVPETMGAYGSMISSVTVLGFDDPEDLDSVYLEYEGGGGIFIDNREDVGKYRNSLEVISGLALPAAESGALIRARIDELRDHDGQRPMAQE